MHSNLNLVVAGLPGLATALEASGRFGQVFPVATTGGLRDLIQKGVLSGSKDELVFLFADNLACDTPQTTMIDLLRKLTSSKWKVILVALTPGAAELAAANPGSGLLEGPFTVNLTLGAISGMGIAPLQPVTDGFEPVEVTGAVAAPKPATAPTGWTTAVVEPEAGAPPPPSAVGAWAPTPVSAPEPAPVRAPQPPAPFQPQPQPPAPAGPAAWAAPTTAPVFEEPAPAPAPGRRSLADVRSTQPPAAQPPAGPSAWSQGEPAASPAPLPQGPGGWSEPEPEAQPVPWGSAAPGPVGWGPGEQAPVARAGTYGAQHALTKRRGFVITITAPKGGTGKSSLTLNLASYLGLRLRAQGKTVCVIDTNFQQADTGKYLNQYTPNITNIVKDPSAMALDRIAQYLVHKPELGLSALLGPATPVDANPVYINGQLYCQVLEVLRQLYDYILIDTPVAEKYHGIFTEFALPQADFIVVPVAPNVPTLMNADAWLRSVTAPRPAGGDGVDPAKIGVVLNRAEEGIDCSEEEVRQELASWTYVGSIPETKEWKRANNNNELVATKNYHELNEAFARVLHAATGEAALMEGVGSLVADTPGLGARLRRMLKKGS